MINYPSVITDPCAFGCTVCTVQSLAQLVKNRQETSSLDFPPKVIFFEFLLCNLSKL